MATSNGGGNGPGGLGGRFWVYLTSVRHFVAAGAAVAGAGAAVGLQSPVVLSALLVAGPYVATVALWPPPPPPPPPEGPDGPSGGEGPPAPPSPAAPESESEAGPGPKPAERKSPLGVSLRAQRAAAAAGSVPRSVPRVAPVPSVLWPQLEELAAFVGSAPLPPSANVPGLLERLRTAGPGPTTEPIVRRRLPLAVDGYLRALTWQPWAVDGADPAAELARAVDEMAALVPAS
ncbi:hypothetical protein OG196_12315 [Kitasatospora purpeofusca]|uniref:hypothetical protein n=1 Tax=Kitasatospora purpeofusca TaxID=67352 RepID=UPI002E145C6D|nr:hypothetical protein OG196_12315 [Kitasatospora purpeofusca]